MYYKMYFKYVLNQKIWKNKFSKKEFPTVENMTFIVKDSNKKVNLTLNARDCGSKWDTCTIILAPETTILFCFYESILALSYM